MSHKEGREWQCSVKLRFEVDEKGTQLPHVRNIAFDSTTDPTKVADILRRAQLAILNPSVDSLKFKSFNLDTLEDDISPLGSTKQFDFSENLVAVHISGSDVVDLSLVDLPVSSTLVTSPRLTDESGHHPIWRRVGSADQRSRTEVHQG